MGLLSDVFRLVTLLRSSSAIRAENLVLRKQLAQYIERGIKPRRVDSVTRISLALLTRLFDWRNAIVVVRPKTIMCWHRAGWRFKCKRGRPPIPAELRALIRKMASENQYGASSESRMSRWLSWESRVRRGRVRKYMLKRPPGQPRADQRWATFLRNHARVKLACDFFVAVTATFQCLYVFVVIDTAGGGLRT